MRAALRILLVTAVALVVGAAPAAADPAKPTNYRSEITAVDPAPDGLRVSIVGGDSFLRVQVDPGHTLVVEDYSGFPYLQILDDGTVQENQQSEATYLNVDRYGLVDQTQLEGLDPEGPPEWKTIDDDGEYAWHDHRIHYMSPDRPEGVEPGDVVLTNDVAMAFDDTPVTVSIQVVLEHGESVVPWVAVVVIALGAMLAAGWRSTSLTLGLAAALAGSVLAVVAGRGQLAAAPAGTGASSLVVIIPTVGLVAVLLAAVLWWRKRSAGAGIGLLASAAALAGWSFLRLSVLWKAVLPTDLAPNLDRFATAAAVGIAIGVAVLTVRSGAVAPTPLTDDPVDEQD